MSDLAPLLGEERTRYARFEFVESDPKPRHLGIEDWSIAERPLRNGAAQTIAQMICSRLGALKPSSRPAK